MNFNPEYRNKNPEYKDAYWFLFCGDKLLLEKGNGVSHIPFSINIDDFGLDASRIYQIGMLEDIYCYTAVLTSEEKIPDGFLQVGLRNAFDLIPADMFWIAGRACHLLYWLKNNRFCGCCGNKMEIASEERAIKCTSCDYVVYPRISPAIIVAVTKEDKILLARAKRFPQGFYGVIAGFVEPGETLEQCVAREVKEEVGIEVKNIRYFASQPWPFPDSLMVAFTAEYAGGEIEIDNVEIEDAGWYTKDHLPVTPSSVSVARKLIDWYLTQVHPG